MWLTRDQSVLITPTQPPEAPINIICNPYIFIDAIHKIYNIFHVQWVKYYILLESLVHIVMASKQFILYSLSDSHSLGLVRLVKAILKVRADGNTNKAKENQLPEFIDQRELCRRTWNTVGAPPSECFGYHNCGCCCCCYLVSFRIKMPVTWHLNRHEVAWAHNTAVYFIYIHIYSVHIAQSVDWLVKPVCSAACIYVCICRTLDQIKC